MSELLKNWKTEYKGAAIYSLVDPMALKAVSAFQDTFQY